MHPSRECTHAVGHGGPCPICVRQAKALASVLEDRFPPLPAFHDVLFPDFLDASEPDPFPALAFARDPRAQWRNHPAFQLHVRPKVYR